MTDNRRALTPTEFLPTVRGYRFPWGCSIRLRLTSGSTRNAPGLLPPHILRREDGPPSIPVSDYGLTEETE